MTIKAHKRTREQTLNSKEKQPIKKIKPKEKTK
jgi:hypothetical protein